MTQKYSEKIMESYKLNLAVLTVFDIDKQKRKKKILFIIFLHEKFPSLTDYII